MASAPSRREIAMAARHRELQQRNLDSLRGLAPQRVERSGPGTGHLALPETRPQFRSALVRLGHPFALGSHGGRRSQAREETGQRPDVVEVRRYQCQK